MAAVSGMCHFRPIAPSLSICASLDFECAEAAGSLDSSLFLETLEQRGATVCGSGPISLLLDVLHLLGGDDIYQATLDYQTSGELTGTTANR